MRPVHYFENTSDAYDATQMGINVWTEEDVKWMDIIVVKSEGVVGVSATWPIAVTVHHGQLHHISEDHCPTNKEVGELLTEWAGEHTPWDKEMNEAQCIVHAHAQFAKAVMQAKTLGYAVRGIHAAV